VKSLPNCLWAFEAKLLCLHNKLIGLHFPLVFLKSTIFILNLFNLNLPDLNKSFTFSSSFAKNVKIASIGMQKRLLLLPNVKRRRKFFERQKLPIEE
jgi:hypothetical protein